MVFTSIKQFDFAKKSLINNNKNIEMSLRDMNEKDLFEGISEEDLKESLKIINEGIGDSLINFLSSKLGGGISKIKTILDQIKETELKLNSEEIEIYTEFYRIIEDEKQLEKDKLHPSYKKFTKELENSKWLLNKRLNELNKSTNEILSALEEKVKDLIGNNERKRKYFNVQRSSDILETRKDRYEKIKSLVSKSTKRSKELENFFGTDQSKIEKEIEKSEENLKKYTKIFNEKNNENIPGSFLNQYSTDPESDFSNRLFHLKKLITEDPKEYKESIEKNLDDLIKDIDQTLLSHISNSHKRKLLYDIRNECLFVKKNYQKIK